jgi:hypothetical protein
MEKIETDPGPKERSLTGDSSKGPMEGHGDLPCSLALQRASVQNPSVLRTGDTPSRKGGTSVLRQG